MSGHASERRVVAIVFAQVLGDFPDEGLFAVLRGCVEKQGGAVDKFIGDVVMAVFGAPVARGDDTARAVRAALAMRAAARGAGRDLRAGINRGEVFWSGVAGERPTAMGDPVNVAQRLQAAAAPGAVVASRSAWDAAGDAFEGRALGELALKGRSEAVEAWELEALPAGVTRRGMHGGRGTPFLGRERELGRLAARFESGRGGLVVVRGAPGTGKSRLLAEFRRLARLGAPGAWVVTGRAPESAAIPRAAFGEIVREATGLDGGTDPGALARAIAADLGGGEDAQRRAWADLVVLSLGFAAPGAAVREMDPLHLRSETAHAWASWIRARAGGRPALLCLEDLQWADPDTRELLEDLAAGLADSTVLLAGASRPEAPPLAGADVLDLEDLPLEAAREVASAALGAPVGDALATFLAERAGGNPLYVEELCRYLRDRGLVAGVPRALAGDAAGIPGGLQDLLVAQADLLGAETKEALKGASVVGGTFWTGLVGRVLGRDSPADIREARDRSLVASRASSLLPDDCEFVFRHALIRDALYALLPRKDRARLHGLVADDLAGPSRPQRLDLLSLAARHAEAAGDRPRAAALWMSVTAVSLRESTLDHSLRAAREAVRLGAGPDAVVAAAEAQIRLGLAAEALAALDALPPVEDPDLAARISLVRSGALVESGQILPALEAAVRARSLAKSPAVRASAMRAEARTLEMLGRREESRALAERGRADLEAGLLPPGPARDNALAGFFTIEAILAWWRGEPDLGLELNERAYRCSLAAGNRETAAGALHNRAIHLRRQGRHVEALAAAERALELRREIGDRSGIGLSLNSLSAGHFEAGRYREAVNCALESAEMSREARTPETLARALLNLAIVLTKVGRLDRAVEAVGEAVEIRRRMALPGPLAFALVNGAFVRLVRREFAEALALLEEAEPLSRTRAPEIRAEYCCHMSAVRCEEGRLDEALALAGESVEAARIRPVSGMLPFALEQLSAVLLRRGEAGKALEAAGEAHANRRGGPTEGIALLARGRAQLATGDAAGAEAQAVAVVAGALRQGERPLEADARDLRAAALRALGREREGDAEAAEARAIRAALGAPRLAEAGR
ncbi:MAG: AAA family ATPase [Planctomycetia bacterium]|nr:AAA family ATPase [Planctomycetia bacterium]